MKNNLNKRAALKILTQANNITRLMLDDLAKMYGVDFEIIALPRYSRFPADSGKIRLFRFDDKIFT